MSSKLFGRRCRLPLLLWIARHEKGRFYQSEPPREVVLQSYLPSELSRLIELGMLIEERQPGERRVYYERKSSPLWKIVNAAGDVLGDDGPPV